MEGIHAALTAACWLVGGFIALSGIDDLLLDGLAHLHRLVRRLTVYRRHPRASCASLPRHPEQSVAILVPAWREAAVIGTMLRTLRARLRYRNYHVFIGTYANDPATAAAARAADPPGCWSSVVTFDIAGPTTKADCLNRLWRAVTARERERGRRIDLVVLHDAEDIVHADELRIFNCLGRRADMVQLPVVPLIPRRRAMIAGHYLDEFAESHQKDLVVREWLAGGVPSAGVGCAFRRDALGDVAALNGGRPFSESSLTEDYALALALMRRHRRTIFVRLQDADGVAVATREYFPDDFRAAVRQKARWLTGIVLQSWAQDGWTGSLGGRYMLLRDRKAILAALLSAAAYALVLVVTLYSGLALLRPDVPPLVQAGEPLSWLLTVNFLLLLNRAGHRMGYVWRLAGPLQALLSLPRIAVANAINCGAALRALRLYVRHRRRGVPLRWDKTLHRFPERTPAE